MRQCPEGRGKCPGLGGKIVLLAGGELWKEEVSTKGWRQQTRRVHHAALWHKAATAQAPRHLAACVRQVGGGGYQYPAGPAPPRGAGAHAARARRARAASSR